MIKNRFFAAIYRLAGFAITLCGLVLGSGHNSGAIRFLFYTAQSNILACAFFLFAAILSIRAWIKDGKYGSVTFMPAIQTAVTTTITFTLLVYWCALAPLLRGELLNLGNIIVHTVAPLMMIFDYVFLCEAGKLKKGTVGLCLAVPTVYFVSVIILGFSGIVFYVRDGVEYHFPYYFMDFDLLGAMGAVYLGAISTIYAILAILVCKLDKVWKKPELFARRVKEGSI